MTFDYCFTNIASSIPKNDTTTYRRRYNQCSNQLKTKKIDFFFKINFKKSHTLKQLIGSANFGAVNSFIKFPFVSVIKTNLYNKTVKRLKKNVFN